MERREDGEAVFDIFSCENERKNVPVCFDRKGASREWGKRSFLLLMIAAMGSLSVTEFTRGIYRAVMHERLALYCFLLSVLSFAAAFFISMYVRVTEKPRYDEDACRYGMTLSDRYVKRTSDAICVFFFLFAIFLLSEWDFRYLGNSKVAESLKHFADNFPVVTLGLFSVLLNLLLLREVHDRISDPKRKEITLHILGLFLFAAIFWAAVAGVMSLIGTVGKVFIIASVIFFLSFLMYDLTLRKRVLHGSALWDRKRLAALLAVAVVIASFSFMNRETWYTQPYINTVLSVPHGAASVTYDDASGVYTMTIAGGEFKILHLTDIHLGGSFFSRKKDILALTACYKEISYTCPDLVIVTGDLTYPVGLSSLSFNNSAPVQQFAAFMRNVGIPWAFAYGNHDTESIASLRSEELIEVYKSLSYKTSGTLLYPYVQPSVTGRNNQLIEVRNADGKLNTALFLLDSNAYTGEGINKYDYIHDDQVDWYEGEVRRLEREAGGHISSLIFFHIPLQEYRTAYDLYLEGSDQVTYYFGENNERLIDTICCSAHPSSLFDRIVALGSTTGVFCGHDHYNNMSLAYRGVRLTYGMSIDYLVMPGISEQTAQRGGELITIKEDASWDVRQIPLTSIE